MPRETRHRGWWALPGVPKAKKVGTCKMPVGRRIRLAHKVHELSTERQQRTKREIKQRLQEGFLRGASPP